ncbi:MAG TPA: hypothetical protein VK563_06910 [Puia sp.]|nr:hypothetical protein [Puia sp.]
MRYIPSLASLFVFWVILSATSCTQQAPPENLIVNGDAETPKYDSVPAGWLNVQGHWVSFEEDSVHHDVVYAQHGKYIFFAGNDTLGILQQDVDVSKWAHGIDAQKQQFIFSGYVQSLDQGPNSDQSALSIAGMDNSKGKILYTFSDTTRSMGKWLPVTDTFMAPVNTRFIRIRMVAIRHVGGDNDGYFDNFTLTTRGMGSLPVWVWIVLVVLVAGGAGGIVWWRRRRHL